MRNQVFKKLFSVLLALIMVAGLLPASVLAEGEGNADSTPAPTEAVQPTESAEPTAPTETETPEVTEVPEPTPENPAATVEPTQGEPTAEPTDEGIMPANVMPVQANVAARDISKDGFIRIFHLDCGRKYFSVSEINGIIDQLAENNYTHIQLAFGNDGFRFILNEMSVTVGDNTYDSDTVKNAITDGNSTYSFSKNTASTTLSQSDMDEIISHANNKNIGVIPMLNTPGHMHALVSAMQTLRIRSTTGSEMDLNSEAEVNFIKALQQKYIAYFAEKGSDHYNFAADEYSFSSLNDAGYTKFAEYVNALANMVKKANMTPMAYNDGIYYSGKTTSVPFDTDIQICYWAQATNYASVQELAAKNFKIINNNDAWYYVLGDYLYSVWGTGQWGYDDALKGIKDTPVTQAKNTTDGEIELAGSVLCCWCDGPSVNYTDDIKQKVYALIKTMADANPDYFKKEAANVPAVEISENGTNVKITKETVDGKTVYKAAVKADGSSTIQLKVVNIDNTVNWASDKNEIATVDGNGLVTFKGVEGIVTITATPVAATSSINETAAYSITFNVTKEGEVPQIEKDITVVEGGMATDVIEGYNYDGQVKNTDNPNIAEVISVVGQNNATATTEKVISETQLKAGKKYLIYNIRSGATLTSAPATRIDPSANGLKLDGRIIASNSNWWEIVEVDGKYTINYNGGSAYLITGDSSASVTSTQTKLDIAYSESGKYWNISYNGCYLNHFGGNGSVAAGWAGSQFENAASDYGSWWEIYEIIEAGKSTTVTFKGVSEGTTSATIGHVKYNITVTKENVTNAPKLPVQLWITNRPIEVTGVTTKTSGQFNDNNNGGYGEYILAEAKSAYGKDGVSLSSLVPPAVKNNAVTGIDDRDAHNILWKGVVLNSTTGLQLCWQNDMTMAEGRIDYQYVRYFGGKWAVSADRVNWTEVTGEGSTGSSSGCKEQVIAYYMQRTNVTNEILTDVVDWGNTTDKWNKENPKQYAVLDFAVQYPTERIPDTFPVEGKSVYYHCDQTNTNVVHKDSNDNYYRRIGLIKGINTDNYEVYMITVTPTSDNPADQLTNANTGLTTNVNLQYNGTEKVVWVDDEANLPAEFTYADAKYKSISGKFEYKVGGEPNVPGLEIYQRQGMLVTYYLRAKVVQDSLNVYYVDRSANDYVFYNYTISVANGTVFKDGIGLNGPWKGNLKDGDVANIVGVTEWVTADLSAIPQIGAQYRYSNYECKEVARKDEGKSVYLYYEFSAKITFVVDFGLPLVITPQRVNAELANATISKVLVDKTSQYADIKVNDTDKSITYTLNRMINGKDNISITYEGVNSKTGNSSGVTYTVTIIPATSVYYEDSFAKFYGSDGKEQTGFSKTNEVPAQTPGVWYIDGQEKSATQALEALGNKTNVYGYDPAYDKCTMFSMGSARKVTVTNDMATTGVVWPTAQFTFKGTGFDIISLTDNTSGAIYVSVYPGDKAEGTPKKYVVNNYYGYDYFDGKWVVKTDAGNNALYQIPVIKIKDLDYGTYTVVIKVAYSAFQDVADKKQYSFWLDAVRVYDPMGTNNSDTYAPDGEAKPVFVEVRDMLLSASSVAENNTNNGVVFIDGNGSAAIATDYKNFGPNHEVYLANNQAIAFRIADATKYADIQIGIKSTGNSVVKYKINNDTEATIGTATDMYYSVKDYASNGSVVTIINTGETVLSITNIKCTMGTSSAKTDTVDLVMSAEDVAVAISMVNSAITPVEPEPEPEPEKTFEPDRFEASWSRNVMQGRKATLTVKTSEDVEAITVDGQTIRSYRTRTERVGFGRRAKRITYREFTYSMVAQESADFSVTAINAEGIESEAITARLTVKTRPNSMRDMWDWFKGWF